MTNSLWKAHQSKIFPGNRATISNHSQRCHTHGWERTMDWFLKNQQRAQIGQFEWGRTNVTALLVFGFRHKVFTMWTLCLCQKLSKCQFFPATNRMIDSSNVAKNASSLWMTMVDSFPSLPQETNFNNANFWLLMAFPHSLNFPITKPQNPLLKGTLVERLVQRECHLTVKKSPGNNLKSLKLRNQSIQKIIVDPQQVSLLHCKWRHGDMATWWFVVDSHDFLPKSWPIFIQQTSKTGQFTTDQFTTDQFTKELALQNSFAAECCVHWMFWMWDAGCVHFAFLVCTFLFHENHWTLCCQAMHNGGAWAPAKWTLWPNSIHLHLQLHITKHHSHSALCLLRSFRRWRGNPQSAS